MGINSQPNIVNNHRDLPNHILANINQIKVMNQYNLKKLKIRVQACKIMCQTSLQPGLSISSWLLACRGCPAFTGFRITLSPITTCKKSS